MNLHNLMNLNHEGHMPLFYNTITIGRRQKQTGPSWKETYSWHHSTHAKEKPEKSRGVQYELN